MTPAPRADFERGGVRLFLGDCLEVMAGLPDASVDAIITDPPYPEINRPYGRMTEVAWHAMMRGVVAESRRILKPTGSAVFILQPNSERVGKMRPWLFEFQAWACREWNMVQDAYWWNTAAMPVGGCNEHRLLRASVKPCVWLGAPDCYRDQDSVLWDESEASKVVARCARARNAGREISPSGQGTNRGKADAAAQRRGGVTPFNLIPTTHGQGAAKSSAGSYGHPAGTPLILADWWTRYISPPDGVVLDPFVGSATMGMAALALGREFIGIERDTGYFDIAQRRLTAALESTPLFSTA